jgi:hypothetical protein
MTNLSFVLGYIPAAFKFHRLYVATKKFDLRQNLTVFKMLGRPALHRF